MPKVLTKLRIDEISAVDRAAGEGCKVVLYKRDDSDERRGFYHRLFAKGSGGRVARHPPRMRSHDVHSTRAEALRGLLFTPDGHALMRARPDTDIDTLADHLVEASQRPTEREDTDMNKMELITKSDVGMHAFCKGLVDRGIAYPHWEFDSKVLEPYARNKFPTLHPGNAIAKVLLEERPVAAAYSAVHSAYHPAHGVAKAVVADDDDDDDTDAIRRAWEARRAAALRRTRQATRPDPLDDDGAGDEGGRVVDDALGDEKSALAALQRLAVETRKADPKLTREQAFSKVYTDPANARLAARERAENRPR
jgi:hypothetical protein